MTFNIGENVGAYQIIEKLGQGGMATVYKAYHARLDRYVALKVLHPAFTKDPNFQARFQREAQVVARLDHPNIVPIFDYSEHDDQPYLVMKYIEGQTLKARLQSGSVSREEGITIIKAVGKALAYAHEKDILHRDIKPSNVLLSNDGHIYLTDFGLARIASAGESTLSNESMLGTPQYISPEQAMGVSDLDEGTDIYSFGVLVYELVVGRVPFSADTPFSIIHDHIYSPLPLPRHINPNVPEGVERFLLKSLAKERRDRFSSVNQMVSAFQKAADTIETDSSWPVPVDSPEIEVITGSTVLQEAGALLQDPPRPDIVLREVSSSEGEKGSERGKAGKKIDKDRDRSQHEKKKRKWGCIFIPTILVLGVIFLGVFFSILHNWGGADNYPDSMDLTLESQMLSTDEFVENKDDFQDALRDAEEKILDDPENAYAYLEISILYYGHGDTHKAVLNLENANEIARRNKDFTFFIISGERLVEESLWGLALQQYISANEMNPKIMDIGKLKVDVLNKTLYFAIASEDFDPDIILVAQEAETYDIFSKETIIAGLARYNILHTKDYVKAESLLNDLLRENPDSANGLLVKADLLMKTGNPEGAREILEKLISPDFDCPAWIKIEARRIITKIE
ncbi:MAG: protein kinase [Anaerolineales bacterium]|nr:protein kinase [Anaerolineales bacterium]